MEASKLKDKKFCSKCGTTKSIDRTSGYNHWSSDEQGNILCKVCYSIYYVDRKRKQCPLIPCECGCGKMIFSIRTDGMPARFHYHCPKPNSRPRTIRRGKSSHRWKGGRTASGQGYVNIHMPNHPRAHGKRVLEHVLVMEDFLSKSIGHKVYVSPEFRIHHKNEIRNDNRIENLEIMTLLEHASHHYENILRCLFNGRFEKYNR